MLPATAFSSALTPSANSAVVRVDKATSEFLNGPDWTLNIDICDTLNANPWLAKDVVKALKKRLQHKNPHVQFLSLTLLETVVKNCGENVHFQIAERNLLPEMIKIVKKKTDMRVREKVLQSGVQFPQRSPDAAPIFTPPITHPPLRSPQANYGMPSNSSTRLDEAMASEIENLSVSTIESMRNVSALLSEMLQEVDPNDRAAVKDEVIVDVVGRCRSNQKKLMQMLASTTDEELLGQGIELNDYLQTVLAKHDAIAFGSPIPLQVTSSATVSPSVNSNNNNSNNQSPQIKLPIPTEEDEEKMKSSVAAAAAVSFPATPLSNNKAQEDEDEEDEDDFALLARRHTKAQTGVSPNGGVVTESGPSNPETSVSMALTMTDPPPPVNSTRADDMIDFLSLALSSVSITSTPSQPPPAATSPPQNIDRSPPVSAAPQPYPYQPQRPSNSYVVPWAQSEPQAQAQVQPQPMGYIPPPWAATPGYYTNNPYASSVPYTYASPVYNNVPAQQVNTYSNNMRSAGMNGDSRVGSNNAGGAGQSQQFIPSYRLFEDLNVLGNQKTGGASSGSSSGQSMMGGKE
ncbi:TOM1-like protein 6 isoform X2 [Bidens hawaiensis]|uniref:TOM1-like protein 6 isoform X2 n=1 Tax=Bidens hawaiensis TaxID=980011 RepID=UPI00404A4A40